MKKHVKSKKINPKIYKSPLNSKGKPSYVPVVYKSKEALIGFIEGTHSTSSLVGIDKIPWSLFLSSERFNDITYKEDKKLSKMTKKERIDYIKEIILDEIASEDNSECTEDILSDYYFSVSCICGNFIGYESIEEIPKENLKCDLCSRTIIHYTGKNDEEFMYDGKSIDMEPYIAIAEEELGIEPENLDEEDE